MSVVFSMACCKALRRSKPLSISEQNGQYVDVPLFEVDDTMTQGELFSLDMLDGLSTQK